jgi:calcineurin-like phosphoesterase family protein/uncharacterized protein (DUF433 family)
MPETYFTADSHFGHVNIIDHCKRPFGSVDEMTEAMIERWNAIVGPHDDVWHLGDVAYRMKPEPLERVFRRLNGRKHLIIGNHDDKHTLRLAWSSEPKDRRAVKVPGEALPVIRDHYALRTWPKAHYGAVHLYGHSHGALPGVGRSVDVGVDVWDFRPVTLAELRPKLERQHEELERQRDATWIMRERAVRGDPAAELEILRRVPDVAPEAGNEILETRVVVDPGILGGEPHVAGTTVLARSVLDAIRDGDLDFEILATHPTLPGDAVHAVREWATGREVPDGG